MISQLKWRFILILMTLVSCVLFFSLFGNYISAKIQLEEEATNFLSSIAHGDWSASQYWDIKRMSIPYFSIDMYQSGQVVALWDEYYQLTESDLIRVATVIVTSGSSRGTLPALNLRYVCLETSQGFRIVCSDLSFETVILERFFRSSLFFGLFALVFLFLISLKLSQLLLKPVEDAWTQQQQFVADASHELKTPLTVIMSSAEMLQDSSALDASCSRWIENISSEGQRMQRLIEDMLSLMKYQEEYGREVVDIYELLDYSILTFEPIAFEKNILLDEILSPPSSKSVVLGNKDKLQQLFYILLDNAVKYSLSPSTIRLRLSEQHKYLLFTISNPSPPLTPSQCGQIFHRFYRQDTSRSCEKGYGLGLPIAQAIVQGHNGKISACYEEGWLTFTVHLPLLPLTKENIPPK